MKHCQTIRLDDKTTAIVCGGRGRRKKCAYCSGEEQFQCDFPVGKKRNGQRRTCDRGLCADCTQKGVTPGVDFCREHYGLAKAAYEQRTAHRISEATAK